MAMAAERFHRQWREGRALPLSPFDEPGRPSSTEPEPPTTARPRVRVSLAALRDRLVGAAGLAEWLSAAELRVFLRHFLRREGADPSWARPLLREWLDRAAAARRHLVLRVFRRALRASDYRGAEGGISVRAVWSRDPAQAERLAGWIREAEADPATQVLKETPSGRVFRASIGGRDALVKCHRLSGWRRWTYLFRASRAARAWASARALGVAGIPTPEPLGLLELRQGGWPVRSYYLCRYQADAPDLRRWVEETWTDWSPARRRVVRRQLAGFLLQFYRNGIHHPDTKASNLLVRHAGDDARRLLMIIDLECMACRPLRGRHDIVRNLVQLNGALAHVVPRADRCRFLRELRCEYPWLGDRRVVRRIERWTSRRLDHERQGRCGF